MKKKPPTQDEQLELALASVLPHARFPGRTMLLIAEVADALQCTPEHVEDLIDEKKIVAVNIAGATLEQGGANKTARRCLRVPVSAYDAFVRAGANAV